MVRRLYQLKKVEGQTMAKDGAALGLGDSTVRNIVAGIYPFSTELARCVARYVRGG